MRFRFPPTARTLLAIALGLCTAIAPLRAPVLATPKATQKSPHLQCRGVDILDEMLAKDPATHARILDEAAKVQNADAILWRIEKRGVAPSHLMGTMHVSDVRITTLSPAAAKALDGSKSVLLEVADLSPEA
ncbi:MAG: TraB/GumN family protein, partial [Hyphomicrobium sp.]